MNVLAVTTPEQLKQLERTLITAPLFAYDTETTGLEWWRTRVFMLSFSVGTHTWVVPTKHFEHGQLVEFLTKVMADKRHEVVGHHLKFDMHQTKQTFGVDVFRQLHDTKVMAHLLDENRYNSLKPLLKDLLNMEITEEAAVKAWLKEKFKAEKDYDYSQVPDELMVPYSGKDAYGTYQLMMHLKPKLLTPWGKPDEVLWPLYETERQVLRITYLMEHEGVKVDVPYCKKVKAELEEVCELGAKEVFDAFGSKFDVNSSQALAEVLYDKLGLPVLKTTRAGERSTDDEVLGQLDHPVAEALQRYRSHFKNLTGFIEPLLNYVDEHGYLHGNFNQTGTKTGRFSSSQPNLQNIPKDGVVRRAFVCDEGTWQFYLDQSQIEMVGFAHYSNDPTMVAALREGRDLHTATAAEVFGVPYDQVTSDQRKAAKGLNFAIIYGVGKKKLARYLSGYMGRRVTEEEAAEYLKRYKAAKPNVETFTSKVISTVRSFRAPWGHYVKNAFGRVRRLESDKAYVGVNNLIQGWAGDLMKATMVRLYKLGLRLKLNIHDELRLDVRKDVKNLPLLIDSIVKEMTTWPEVRVPIKVTVKCTDTNWAEAKDYERQAA